VASPLEVGTRFHPELTRRENIFLTGTTLSMPPAEIRRKFDAIVDFSGIETFLDTPVKHYSSGMYVRLAFAVAAHLEAEILLVDEVLAVGDMAFQQKCLGKMGGVAQSGRTVVFVSHDLIKMGGLCSKLFWFDSGKIRMSGSPDKVITAYRNLTLKSLIPSRFGLIKKIEISSKGVNTILIEFGDPLVICVDFESSFPLLNPRLGIVIKNELYVPLIGVNNYQYNQKITSEKAVFKGRVKVEFPSLPLLSGGYIIDIFFGDLKKDYEILENAAFFQIKHGVNDVVMNGIDKSINKIYIKHVKWKLEKVNL